MSVSIVTCPNCNSLLLTDTAQCPTCHHVLHGKKAAPQSENKLHSEVMGSTSDEVACPDCGEMCRKELVRCWRCGGFLRSDMAEKYQQMRENTVLPEAPVLREIMAMSETASRRSRPTIDDDDDFALGPGVQALAPSETESPPEDDDTFSLNLPALPTPVEQPELPDIPLALPASEVALAATSADKTAHAPTNVNASIAEATRVTVPTEEGEAHSVSSAGDVLLDIARQEELESESRRKTRGKKKSGAAGPKTGFIIFCPYGHQIEVQERHRGQMGKCPRCKSAFIVPQAIEPEKSADTTTAEATAAPVDPPGMLVAGKYTRWLNDIHVHPLDPTTLKLKPGSLEAAFTAMDVAFGVDGLLMITLGGKKGMFGGKGKKPEEIRAETVAHLAAGKPLTELLVTAQRLFAADTVKQIQVVQPAQYAHESMFAGIPVFGQHRVAVRLPKPADSNDLMFASFAISEFREFAKEMSEVFGISELGVAEGVPLTDKFADFKCHYTDQVFQALENTDYHQADSAIKLKIVGRKCEGCGLIVSEDGRKKEKLGGLDGKGIAKAKCPKCQKKFGSLSLYAVEAAAAGPAESPDDAEPSSEPQATTAS